MLKRIFLFTILSIAFLIACSESDDLGNSQNDNFDRANMQTNLAQAGPNSQSAIMWQCKLDIYNGVLSWVQSHPVIQSVSPPWQC